MKKLKNMFRIARKENTLYGIWVKNAYEFDDGIYIAKDGWENWVYLYDIKTGYLIKSFKSTLKGAKEKWENEFSFIKDAYYKLIKTEKYAKIVENTDKLDKSTFINENEIK